MAIDWTNLFRQYKGKWVALKDDERTVIASGSTARSAINGAKKKGYSHPILFKVPTRLMPYVGILRNEIRLH